MFGRVTSVGYCFPEMESDLASSEQKGGGGGRKEEEEGEERVLRGMLREREAQYLPIHARWQRDGQEVTHGKCCYHT